MAWALMASIDATCGVHPAETPAPSITAPSWDSHGIPGLRDAGTAATKEMSQPSMALNWSWQMPDTKCMNTHLLALPMNKSPRHDLQGMFFHTCKKAGTCMGMSCKSPENKKMKLLLTSTRRCWVLYPLGNGGLTS